MITASAIGSSTAAKRESSTGGAYARTGLEPLSP